MMKMCVCKWADSSKFAAQWHNTERKELEIEEEEEKANDAREWRDGKMATVI